MSNIIHVLIFIMLVIRHPEQAPAAVDEAQYISRLDVIKGDLNQALFR